MAKELHLVDPRPSPNQHTSDPVESDMLRSFPKTQHLRSKDINIIEDKDSNDGQIPTRPLDDEYVVRESLIIEVRV